MSGKIVANAETAIGAGCNGEPLKMLIMQMEIVDATTCVDVVIVFFVDQNVNPESREQQHETAGRPDRAP